MVRPGDRPGHFHSSYSTRIGNPPTVYASHCPAMFGSRGNDATKQWQVLLPNKAMLTWMNVGLSPTGSRP